MLPANPKKKICNNFEPQAWRKVLCKNCFKTREEHNSSLSTEPTQNTEKTDHLVDRNNDSSDPNQKDIIRKCLGASALKNSKLRHSLSLECMSSDGHLIEKVGQDSFEVISRRSMSPSLGERFSKGFRPATPFIGSNSSESSQAISKVAATVTLEEEEATSFVDKNDKSKGCPAVKLRKHLDSNHETMKEMKSHSNETNDDVEGDNDKNEIMSEKSETSDVFSQGGTEQALFQQQLNQSTPPASSTPKPASASDDAECSHEKVDEAIGFDRKFVASSQINNTLPGSVLNLVESVTHYNNNITRTSLEEKENKCTLDEQLDDSKTNHNWIKNTTKVCDNREKNKEVAVVVGKNTNDPPSPAEFDYTGTRIDRNADDGKSLDSPVNDNSIAAYSSVLNVSVINKTVELNPRVDSGLCDNKDHFDNRRYISYLANESIGTKDSNLSSRISHRRRSFCDEEDMSSYDFLRSEAMMEGQKLLMESLRERNSSLEEQFKKMEREKAAIIDLLTNKKDCYERMKEHYNATISELDSQVQRLQLEKNSLLDKLQLPESQRFSLAAEEKEIAELRRKLEESENRLIDFVEENEDLKQEVRDVQLEMAELHDQFREEETLEFRELQKELEAAAKNYRILQFKLRKAERHNDQLENDRVIYEEKLRHFESCIQSSDDKRRARMLEEEMRAAKEANQRLHEELARTEEKRRRTSEDLDRTKNSLNEADSKRLCLQNEIDNMKHEIGKLREQLKYENRHDYVSVNKSSRRSSISTDNPIIIQLTKDLKDSLERENDLKEQLKFTEKECSTVRKKLTDMEAECEGLNLQLRQLTTAKASIFSKTDSSLMNDVVDGELGDKECELVGQLELAEEEIRSLKRQHDDIQKENDSLMVAIKYLRSKLEQRDGVRCSTPIGESKSTREFLSRIPDIPDSMDKEDELRSELDKTKREFSRLLEKFNHLTETQAAKQTTTSDAAVSVYLDEENIVKENEIKKQLEENLTESRNKIEELNQEIEKLTKESSSKAKTIEEYQQIISDLENSTKELESTKEASKTLESKIKELSEQIERNETENCNKTKINVITNTDEDKSDMKTKVDELEEKLKQKELAWEQERGSIEEEANVGCDIATKINRELSSLNESLMDEKLKLLKDKQQLIESQDKITNERDELSDKVNTLTKEKSLLEKTIDQNQKKPENDFKMKEENLRKQFHEEKVKLETRMNDFEDTIKELERKNESLDKKYRKVTLKRDKDETEKKELQEEIQVLKEKFDKKLYKETEKRRRSEVFVEENKGNEVELLVKLRKDLEDKEKLNDKLNRKLKKAEELQSKLESELKEIKKTKSQSIPNQRSPGDGEDYTTDENGNKLIGKNPALIDGDVVLLQDQITILQNENEKLTQNSYKTVAEIKKLFEEEQKSRKNDKEEIEKLKSTIEEKQKQIIKNDKELDDMKDKLRRETSSKLKVENKLKSLESSASSDAVSETKKPSTLSSDEKKAMDFRSKFEKFGGASRTPRKLSIPSTFESSTPSLNSSSSSSSDFLKDMQRQLSELEAARSADREELLKKIESQRLEFDKEKVALEEKNKQLEDRLKDWSKCQQGILASQLEFELERKSWSEERGRLQSRLDQVVLNSVGMNSLS